MPFKKNSLKTPVKKTFVIKNVYKTDTSPSKRTYFSGGILQIDFYAARMLYVDGRKNFRKIFSCPAFSERVANVHFYYKKKYVSYFEFAHKRVYFRYDIIWISDLEASKLTLHYFDYENWIYARQPVKKRKKIFEQKINEYYCIDVLDRNENILRSYYIQVIGVYSQLQLKTTIVKIFHFLLDIYSNENH